MNNDKSGDRKTSDSLDEFATTLLTAAVPVKLGFTTTQTFYGLANLCYVVVFAQHGREQIGTWVQVRARPALVGPGC